MKAKTKSKGKAKSKAEQTMEITPLLSDYWTFFTNYERGLLFVHFRS